MVGGMSTGQANTMNNSKKSILEILVHRTSKVALAAEILGTSLFLICAVLISTSGSVLTKVLFILSMIGYSIIRFCASVRWYKGGERYAGIELQFMKSLIPMGYLMTLCGLWYLLLPSAIPFALSSLIIAGLAHVNIILIYLHLKDHSDTPPNCYSGKR